MTNVTLEQSKKILDAAEKKAVEINIPMNIVILDSGANLKAFRRMDDALLGSIDIAMKKAKTSVLFNMNSEGVYEFCKPGASAPGLEDSNDGLAVFPGGVPILDSDGKLAGAIGVSGGLVEHDAAVANAGVAALGDN